MTATYFQDKNSKPIIIAIKANDYGRDFRGNIVVNNIFLNGKVESCHLN